MITMVKTTIPLLLICCITALSLALTNSITFKTIQKRIQEESNLRKKEVLPNANFFSEMKEWETKADSNSPIREVYYGIENNKKVGLVMIAKSNGYGGLITVYIGINQNGTVNSVKMGDNKETPGLGTKVAEAPHIQQYCGKSITDGFKLVKSAPSGNQIQAITGATISSRGILVAVDAAARLSSILLNDELTKNEL